MRQTVAFLVLGFFLFGASACGGDEPDGDDPCAGVVCERGQDCVNGVCIDRVDPEPTGCQSNQDCLFNSSGELCDRESGRCVACFTNAHCSDGRACEAGSCVGPVCTTDGDCGPDAPHCNAAGDACVGCLDDDHCEDGLVCLEGSCQEPPPSCEADRDCEDEGAPYCVEGACVGCRGDETCAEGEACSGAGACLPNVCEADADCDAFPGRTCRDGMCAPGVCDTSAECLDPNLPFCDSNQCVACTATEGCVVGSTCVDGAVCEAIACEDLLDCPVGSVCEDDACVGVAVCAGDGDCQDPRAPLCGDTGCAACLENEHCGPFEQCQAGSCVPFDSCSTSLDCNGGFSCVTGACVACASDAHCPRGVCAAGACVDAASCSSDADCASGSCAGGTCATCTWDQGCAPGLWCEDGACVGGATCDEENRCPVGQVCDAGACVTAACDDDAFEPDQGPFGARAIPLRSPAARTLCPGDEDWFVFTAPAAAAVDIAFLQAPEGAELALVWFSPDGERRRMEKAGVDGRWIGRLPEAAASRYYVVVRSNGGAAGDYSLLVTPNTACTDPFEPNETFGEAAPFTAGRLFEDLQLCGLDHYSLEVPAGQALTYYALYSTGNLDLLIFDEDGANLSAVVQQVSDLGGGKRARLAPAGEDRTVILRVRAVGTAPPAYSLYAALEEAAACGEGELILAAGEDRARIVGSNLGSEGVASSSCGTLQGRRDYVIQLSEPSRVLAHVEGSFRPRLALYEAGCAAEVACQGGIEGEGTLDVSQVSAGTYVLGVGSEGARGLFDLSVRILPAVTPPANDRCTAPQSIDLAAGVDIASSTIGATADVTACGGLSPDVFYSFLLSSQGRLVFDLEGHTTPHALFLTDGTCTPISGFCGDGARLDLEVPAGAYRLGVAATSGRGSDFQLVGRRVTTPPNDTCAGAIPITPGTTVAGDSTWAFDRQSFPITESCTGYLVGGPDVFYSVDLEGGVPVTITVTPDGEFDVAVYVMESCAGQTCVAGKDDALRGGAEVLTFTPPADGTYLIVVDTALAGGAFTIQVE